MPGWAWENGVEESQKENDFPWCQNNRSGRTVCMRRIAMEFPEERMAYDAAIKKKSGRDSPTEQLSHIPIRPNSPGFDGFFRKQRAFWSLMIHGHESLVTFLMKQASEQLKGEGE